MEKYNRAWLIGFSGAVLSLVLFAWLARQVLAGATHDFDLAVRGAIHSWASPRLTYAMRGVTELGAPAFLVTLGVILAWRLARAGRRRAAVVLVIAACGSEALDQVLKLVFHRQRPEPFFGYALPLSYSFPSGHSIASACFYGVVAAIVTVRMKSRWRKAAIWTVAALLALAVGFSRVYLGVHYPSDVIAGYLAAVIWVAAVRAGYEYWTRRTGAR
ncbi:MAG TPA: phosphatase PAP2 family protein [Bryobacteraceae bacterium]